MSVTFLIPSTYKHTCPLCLIQENTDTTCNRLYIFADLKNNCDSLACYVMSPHIAVVFSVVLVLGDVPLCLWHHGDKTTTVCSCNTFTPTQPIVIYSLLYILLSQCNFFLAVSLAKWKAWSWCNGWYGHACKHAITHCFSLAQCLLNYIPAICLTNYLSFSDKIDCLLSDVKAIQIGHCTK